MAEARRRHQHEQEVIQMDNAQQRRELAEEERKAALEKVRTGCRNISKVMILRSKDKRSDGELNTAPPHTSSAAVWEPGELVDTSACLSCRMCQSGRQTLSKLSIS